MKQVYRLELEEARVMVRAAIAKSEEIGVLESICIVDDGGYPIALERMDGARITGPQIAWNKAFTAAGHKRSTHLFNTPPNGPALPGNEAFGIQWSFDGKFAVFVGGFPIVVNGEVIGGTGPGEKKPPRGAVRSSRSVVRPRRSGPCLPSARRFRPAC